MIARELWEVAAAWPRGSWTWATRVTDRTLDFCIEVAREMGLEREFLCARTADEEVLSAATEFAENAGL